VGQGARLSAHDLIDRNDDGIARWMPVVVPFIALWILALVAVIEGAVL
jgi:hypothetical protein